MDAKVVWGQGLRFEGSADTGYRIPLDASTSVGGSDTGFRPMELIAIGLAGCTAMDVISILMKKRQQVQSFQVDVSAEQATEHPRVFTHFVITYRIKGPNIDEAAVERAIDLSETKYCPAQAMFRDIADIELSYQIEDE
jgi:putative redox protein